MRMLITGGVGFIGRYLAKELLEKGYEVTIVPKTNLKEGLWEVIKYYLKRGEINESVCPWRRIGRINCYLDTI